jgi:hypothetical protein
MINTRVLEFWRRLKRKLFVQVFEEKNFFFNNIPSLYRMHHYPAGSDKRKTCACQFTTQYDQYLGKHTDYHHLLSHSYVCHQY